MKSNPGSTEEYTRTYAKGLIEASVLNSGEIENESDWYVPSIGGEMIRTERSENLKRHIGRLSVAERRERLQAAEDVIKHKRSKI